MQILTQQDWGWGWRGCISNKLQGSAESLGPGTTRAGTLVANINYEGELPSTKKAV